MMDKKYVRPNTFMDFEQAPVADFAENLIDQAVESPAEIAVALYYGVRDEIAYNPYALSKDAAEYRASNILAKRQGFCVQKAVLLCALARSAGIPSRMGFATVRNHLASRKLIQFIGSHVFVFHGYTELWIDNRWIKATPAFNAELCRKYEVPPLEFNGREDAIFQPYNSGNEAFMEYIQYHGSFATVPLTKMLHAWKGFYGADRMQSWFAVQETAPIEKEGLYLREEPFYN